MTMKRNKGNWDLPLYHTDHPRPVTRRQFLSQGFMTGAAYTVGGVAPLLRKYMEEYSATGLPPAYLPKHDLEEEASS